MPGGNLLQRALGAASSAAKKTAGAITGGAKMVGDGIVSGAKAVGNAVVTGAKAVGNAAVAVKDGVKEGVRGATRAVADAGYNAIGAGKDALDSGAKKVSDAYAKAKEQFTGKPPAQPCIACTGKDVDHDGSVFGYVNGKCVPLTEKGQEVTRADIEKAKKSGYNPSFAHPLRVRRRSAGRPDAEHLAGDEGLLREMHRGQTSAHDLLRQRHQYHADHAL